MLELKPSKRITADELHVQLKQYFAHGDNTQHFLKNRYTTNEFNIFI